MHLRSLTLQAIGPFAGRHSIDFGALAQGGLFLLEGPTGSGKSTVIDAIVFALYGKVASAEASEERLRSAYAADDVESVVDLVFEVPSGLYRVRRTPAYQRAKRRGTGTTPAQASVKAWRLPSDADVEAGPAALDGVGVPLGSRLDEIGAEIQRIVGLDRTQFVQTIVLPQGEFAHFLRAKPEDRKDLLQKIFGTEVYERLQKRLAEMRRESDRGTDEARVALRSGAAQLVGAARLSPEEGTAVRSAVEDAMTSVTLVQGVSDVVASTTSSLGALAASSTAVAAEAEGAWLEARRLLDEARSAADLVTTRDRLRRRRAELEASADLNLEAVARLTRARTAQAVRSLLTGLDRALTALDAAEKGVAAALDTAPADIADAPDGSLRSHVRAAGKAAAAEAATVLRLVGVEAGLAQRRRSVRDARAALDDLATAIALDDDWLAGRPAARDALTAALDAARTLAGSRGDRAAAVTSAAEVVAAHGELATCATALALALEQRAVAASAATQAHEQEAQLRRARIDGLAGEIASALADGDACPVCGSAEHPAKAVMGAGHVSAALVDRAESDRARAEAVLVAAAERASGLQERVAVLQARVGSGVAERAESDLVAARAALDESLTAEADVARLVPVLDGFDEETRARESRRSAAVAQLAGDAAILDVALLDLDTAEADVVTARCGHPTVAARHSELLERSAAAEAVLEALGERATARDDVRRRQVELADGLSEHGFETAQEARDALVEPAVLAELEAMVTAYATEQDRVAAGLAEPAIAALPEDLVVDVDAARAAESVARGLNDEAVGAARVASERAVAAEAAGTDVVSAARTLAERIEQAGPVSRLAELTAGGGSDNARSLSLATFVLMRRFEDVVAAANDRLRLVSDGRFELERSDEKEDVRARNTGLAMRVLDHRTGRPQDPRQLSGGETFYVSLCLALGMADVVTAEAGGIDLGTLFVDEGFGSLDEHTLEQVLAELARLRAGGRVVGVVSHVETLKRSIADRIEIRPTPEGPSTLTVRAG
ncbi:AAA family ATPase [Cellulomonas sp. URHE0023]|uniref:AAA family ATPase n=1 Tax=Cellulomonas sp. URHE0023 TaxID=1380354 RepID=UPI0004851841|nr:SMC family ATPase [Cellulomonas sp. URHE0023]